MCADRFRGCVGSKSSTHRRLAFSPPSTPSAFRRGGSPVSPSVASLGYDSTWRSMAIGMLPRIKRIQRRIDLEMVLLNLKESGN